jgi:signal peptidase I
VDGGSGTGPRQRGAGLRQEGDEAPLRESPAPLGTSSRGSPGKRRTSLLEYVLIAVVAVAVALLVQAFLVKPYRIPSPSMIDTLEPGDRVLVNRVIYHLRDVEHGDIVVFRYPLDTKWAFIKRVVGLPGDVLQAKDGVLWRNGEPVDEPYVHSSEGNRDPTNPAGAITGTTMSDPWSLAAPYTVPQGSYFVMGDNRTDSDDSRVWGPVPAEEVIGSAFFIYWPLDRLGAL